MNKELLKKYADLKQQEKEIKEQIDEMKNDVIAEIKAADADKVKSPFGTFTISQYTRWEYSDKVKEAEKRVKEMQEDEKRTGTAKSKVSESVRYTAPKTDE